LDGITRTTDESGIEEGLKYDEDKQDWYAMPLEVLEPLAQVYLAGENKYETFNCLKPFKDWKRRFWSGMMRHARRCQLNPLAIDQELMDKYGVKVYHQAQIAFNALHRLHSALQEEKKNGGTIQ
jgi:hypothetical protein